MAVNIPAECFTVTANAGMKSSPLLYRIPWIGTRGIKPRFDHASRQFELMATKWYRLMAYRLNFLGC
jgi:hypothetical protein